MNYKIMFSIIFAILVVTVIFAFSTDLYIQIYDPNWHGIINSNKSVDSTNGKIFIVGSSNVYAINATSINEQLSNEQKNYLVYNLADQGDNPTRRLNSIDNIISHKPEFVLYGIGIWDFEKPISKLQSRSAIDFLLQPGYFFKSLFQDNIDLYGYGQGKIFISPKDRSLTSLKYILRGPDQPYHPFIKFEPTSIHSNEKLIEDFGWPENNGLDVTEENKKIIALNQIIHKLQENDIKVILFSYPHSKALYTFQPQDLKDFERMLNNKSNEFAIPVYFLHEKYVDLEIWRESLHVAIHPDAQIYADDILKIILKEISQ